MTRYYYDDPLAAAWMAEKFGMKFIIDEQPDYVIDSVSSTPFYKGKYYIRPESLHLIEPIPEDVVQDPDDSLGYGRTAHHWTVISDEQYFDERADYQEDDLYISLTQAASWQKRWPAHGKIFIVTRNQVVFMMPKSEQ